MKRRDFVRGLGLVAPTLALLLHGVASAQTLSRAGTVTSVSGHVIMSRGTSNDVRPLKLRDAILDQDQIGTGEGSSARFLLGGKALVTVRELSSVTVVHQPGQVGLRLSEGVVTLAVARPRTRPEESFEIQLPQAVVSARGGVFVVEATGASGRTVSIITVLSGLVELVTERATLRLVGRESVTVTDGAVGAIASLAEHEIGKNYSAVTADDTDSVRPMTGASRQGDLELPTGLVLPVHPPSTSPIAPALTR